MRNMGEKKGDSLIRTRLSENMTRSTLHVNQKNNLGMKMRIRANQAMSLQRLKLSAQARTRQR